MSAGVAGAGRPEGARRGSKKAQICEQYISNLRERTEVTVGPELIADIRAHFKGLPTLYSIEVNLEGLDVLVSGSTKLG